MMRYRAGCSAVKRKALKPSSSRSGRVAPRDEASVIACRAALSSARRGRVRGRFRVLSVEDASGGERATIAANLKCEGVEKPVCVAELVLLTVS